MLAAVWINRIRTPGVQSALHVWVTTWWLLHITFLQCDASLHLCCTHTVLHTPYSSIMHTHTHTGLHHHTQCNALIIMLHELNSVCVCVGEGGDSRRCAAGWAGTPGWCCWPWSRGFWSRPRRGAGRGSPVRWWGRHMGSPALTPSSPAHCWWSSMLPGGAPLELTLTKSVE